MTALVVIETFVILVLVVLVAGLLRSHAEIVRALHALGVDVGGDGEAGASHDHARADAPVALTERPVGRPAPDLTGVTPLGDAVAVSAAAAREPTLYAFLSSGCDSCRALWEGTPPAGHRTVVVTRSPGEEEPAAVEALGSPGGAPVVMTTEAWHDFDVPGAPYFVLTDADGRVVGEGTGRSWDQVTGLAARAAADRAWANDRERESRNDAELLAAGIGPHDPRLHFGPGPDGDRP